MTDRKSKFLIAGIVLVSLSSIIVCGLRYFVWQEYAVQSAVECDPVEEKCFVSVCDPEEEDCSSDPEDNIWYYKIYEKSAHDLPRCSFGDEACGEMSCDTDNGCTVILCDEQSSLEIGDDCSDPEEFLVDETSEDLLTPDPADIDEAPMFLTE